MRHALFPLLALAVACSQPAPVNTDAALASLRQADSAYTRAGAAKDRAAFVGAYATDGVIYPPEAPTVSGADAIGKFVDGFLADPAFVVVFRPIDIQVSADGTMGYTLNSGDLTYTGPDKKPITEHVRDFHVWRRQADGSWKLSIDIWNPEPPAAGAEK